MNCLHIVGILIGIYHMGNGKQCDLTIQKDGNELQDGNYTVGLGGQINQIYCKALCAGPGPTPALKWYKLPSRRPIRKFRGRVYQVRTTFDRVNILTIRNMLYSDIGTYKCSGWLKGKGWMEKIFELTYGCKGSAHLCDTSRCISEDRLCDGNIDCVDGTDEQSCKECAENQFHCMNGDCIKDDYVCDGIRDCNDASDELNCGCAPSFTCSHGGCVSQDKVCDGTPDCGNGEDELNCSKIEVKVINPIQEVFEGETATFKCEAIVTMDDIEYDIRWSKQEGEIMKPVDSDGDTLVISEAQLNDTGIYVCTGSVPTDTDTDVAELIVNQRCVGEFECEDGTCISIESVCNGLSDCPEGKDELDCDCVGMFQCLDGSCVDDNKWCDGLPDCSDEEDESNCTYCEIDEFHCGLGVCIPTYEVCDSNTQCDDASDESDCGCYDDFECGSGKCIEMSKVCDGNIDCNENGEDELNCGCMEYEFQCDDGTCINSTNRCDHNEDCTSGDDEKDCSCFTDSFWCDTEQCVDQSAVCNDITDCDNLADENNCTEIRCDETNEFTCESKDHCIPSEWRCDGSADCVDGSDECGCFVDEYRCDDGMCINNTSRCDGIPDCEYEDDEKMCGQQICLEGQSLCPDESRCISTSQYCDQQQDCDDGSDENEERCGTGTVEATVGDDDVVEVVTEKATKVSTTTATENTQSSDYEFSVDDYIY